MDFLELKMTMEIKLINYILMSHTTSVLEAKGQSSRFLVLEVKISSKIPDKSGNF